MVEDNLSIRRAVASSGGWGNARMACPCGEKVARWRRISGSWGGENLSSGFLRTLRGERGRCGGYPGRWQSWSPWAGKSSSGKEKESLRDFSPEGQGRISLAGFSGLRGHGTRSVAISLGFATRTFKVPIAFMSKQEDLPLLFNILLLVLTVLFCLSLLADFRLAGRLWIN